MFARRSIRGLLPLCLGSLGFIGTTLIGCNNSGLDSVQVTPTTQSVRSPERGVLGTFDLAVGDKGHHEQHPQQHHR